MGAGPSGAAADLGGSTAAEEGAFLEGRFFRVACGSAAAEAEPWEALPGALACL